MKAVQLYGTQYCPYCVMARRLLTQKGVRFEDIRIDETPSRRAEMEQRSKRFTVPQIFIGDEHVGGCDDLYALERGGRLDTLLAD